MTLAEELVSHCSQSPSDGFGSLMGTTLRLADLLEKYRGRSVRIAEGVAVQFPKNCAWQASDMADGSLQFTFSGDLPRIGAEYGVVRITPDITAIVIRMGAAAIEIQASLRLGMVPMPPFTTTIRLAG